MATRKEIADRINDRCRKGTVVATDLKKEVVKSFLPDIVTDEQYNEAFLKCDCRLNPQDVTKLVCKPK